MERQPAVYTLASERNGTLYIGVTSDLLKRMHEHRTDAVDGFTKKYGVHRLVHFELLGDLLSFTGMTDGGVSLEFGIWNLKF